MGKSRIGKILDTIFPSKCYGCHKSGTPLCKWCLQMCARSVDTPAIFIKSIYSFKDPLIKRSIHAIKYYHRRDLIDPLTDLLAEEIKQLDFPSENLILPPTSYNLPPAPWTLVPIPMPAFRKWRRGYNQANLIAISLSKKSGIPINSNILFRARSPSRQVESVTRGERLKNQKGSFKVRGDVKNANIILVDDVSTTGATIIEARNTLLKAGAVNVQAVTIAH